MKELDFLKKIKKEGKLELVENSEQLKKSYLGKSESNLESAKILLERDKLEESVGLAYYSMYNSLVALLLTFGIKSENHTASIILLKELFGIDNGKIKAAKKERIDKQYYSDFSIAKEEVEEMIYTAEEFNADILDFLAKLNNAKIKEIRKKFQETIR